MYLRVVCIVVFGFAIEGASAGDKVHIKIHVPDIVRTHHHDRYVIYNHKPPVKPRHEIVGFHHGRVKLPQPQKPLRQHQPKQPPKKTQPSPGYHYGNDNPFTFQPYTGKVHSYKTLKSEKYETETFNNPFSDDPANKYIVKSSYKVREKLPFDDVTIGYDKEYSYPISETEHEYQQNEKNVELNTAKTDPFDGDSFSAPLKAEKEEEKNPKQYDFYYKYPSNEYEYQRNVQLVDYYIAKDNPSGALHQQEENNHDDFVFNELDYEEPTTAKYQTLDFNNFGPSDKGTHQNYETDGPSFDAN